jgi:hypothetical protein
MPWVGSTEMHGPFEQVTKRRRWKIIHHWGTQLGDTREYEVSTVGDSPGVVYLKSSGSPSLQLNIEVVRKLHEVFGNILERVDK